MKILIVLFVSFAGSYSFSQEIAAESSVQITNDVPDKVSALGVRFSILKPNFEVVSNYEINKNNRVIDTINYDDEIGFGIGYIYQPIEDFGYNVQLDYITGSNNLEQKLNFIRPSVNVIYGIDPTLSLNFGLNAMKFMNDKLLEQLAVVAGIQYGVGVQFTKNIGLNARYYEMKVSNLLNDPAGVLIEKVQVEAVTQGLEFDLNYTY